MGSLLKCWAEEGHNLTDISKGSLQLQFENQLQRGKCAGRDNGNGSMIHSRQQMTLIPMAEIIRSG